MPAKWNNAETLPIVANAKQNSKRLHDMSTPVYNHQTIKRALNSQCDCKTYTLQSDKYPHEKNKTYLYLNIANSETVILYLETVL